MFHRHQWSDESEFFTPPVEGLRSLKNVSEDMFQKTLYGFTTIIQRCKCGKISTQRFLGKRSW